MAERQLRPAIVLKVALLFVCVVAAWGSGCKSTSMSQYISPRIEGRTLDARTGQPIEGVIVRHVVPGQVVDDPPRGGQAMEREPDIRTGSDGTFVMASQRDFELFQRSGWYAVTIRFQHEGYLTFRTNFTLVQATNTPKGEPLVKAGDIRLQPR